MQPPIAYENVWYFFLISFMKNSVVVEEGTHQALIEKDGEYAKLWMMQAKAFLWVWDSMCTIFGWFISLWLLTALVPQYDTDAHS